MSPPVDPKVASAAQTLVDARVSGRPLTALPETLRPRDAATAYAIQDEVLRLLGQHIGAWKVSMDDAEHGCFAPIMERDLRPSPAELPPAAAATAGVAQFGIEPEIAFRIGQPLPTVAGNAIQRRDTVMAAIESAHTVLEVVVSRYAAPNELSLLDRLADNLINEALILGPACRAWRELPLASLPLAVRVDDQRVHQGVGGHPLGDPLLPLVWFATTMSAMGKGLQPGAIVTTGSCNGVRMVAAGGSVSAEFAGLGEAAVRF
ncbi:MAG TPA: fumarylacetoacetate hydrolase family protein [Steroidobacteraceae bacterium]